MGLFIYPTPSVVYSLYFILLLIGTRPLRNMLALPDDLTKILIPGVYSGIFVLPDLSGDLYLYTILPYVYLNKLH